MQDTVLYAKGSKIFIMHAHYNFALFDKTKHIYLYLYIRVQTGQESPKWTDRFILRTITYD